MKVLIRPANETDIDALVALDRELFGVDHWSEATIRQELASEHTEYWVLDCTGEVLGFAGCLAPRGAGEADIQTIGVHPRLRRQGWASRFMLQLVSWAFSRGAKLVFLEVRESGVPARALYSKLGFSELGRRENYYSYGSSREAAIVMRAQVDEVLQRGDQLIGEQPLVLGIESSCDETGVGIVRGRTLLANAVASSMDEHAKYGGVVPEVAARAHADSMVPVLRRALAEAEVTLAELDAIAVTAGPGLSGALMVGVGAAKALAVATGLPVYAVNHLVGHVAADLLRDDRDYLDFPTVALLVSGGHTSLIRVDSFTGDSQLLGETVDDAAGEAFDKVARVLGLPYPGGPQIDRVAAEGNPKAFRFPRGLSRASDLERHRYDFSFSGLKTAVAREVERFQDAGEPVPVADIAASFREAVADVLVIKALAACRDLAVPRLLLAGGVAANARIRELMVERAEAAGVRLHIPPFGLCTDNGAMIAAVGAELVAGGYPPSSLDFAADSTLPMEREK